MPEAHIEAAFLNAMRPSVSDWDEARRCLDNLESIDPVKRLYYEMALLRREFPRKCDTALKRLMVEIIDRPEVGDATIRAKVALEALNIAIANHNEAYIVRAYDAAQAIRSMPNAADEALSFCAACDSSYGLYLQSVERATEAIPLYKRLIEFRIDDPTYVCWHEIARINLAIAYIDVGELAKARWVAAVAEKHALPSHRHAVAHMLGTIAFAENRMDAALALFFEAYDAAIELDDTYTQSSVQLRLARLFLIQGNVEAFWSAGRTIRALARLHGTKHTLERLRRLESSSPITYERRSAT